MKKVDCLSGFVFLGVSIVLILSKPVMAKNDSSEFIENLDLDKDGYITIREAVTEPRILSAFGTIDCNSDGKISKAELKKAKISTVEKLSTLESD